MTRSCLRVCLVVLALSVSDPARATGPLPEDGDIVLETSRSQQSAAIQWASRSRWSHVGIVERDGDRVAVIEALGTVSRTPWQAWTRRARRGGPYLVLRARHVPPAQRAAAVAEARRLLGRRYDARFGWGDDRIYCSELVVKAYQRGAGVTLGRMERLGDLRLTGLERALEQRWGGPIPKDLRLVTPASIAADPQLVPVR
jgi:hypothetical protein